MYAHTAHKTAAHLHSVAQILSEQCGTKHALHTSNQKYEQSEVRDIAVIVLCFV